MYKLLDCLPSFFMVNNKQRGSYVNRPNQHDLISES